MCYTNANFYQIFLLGVSASITAGQVKCIDAGLEIIFVRGTIKGGGVQTVTRSEECDIAAQDCSGQLW